MRGLQIAERTPPTFLLRTEDDYVNSVNNSLAYYVALEKGGRRSAVADEVSGDEVAGTGGSVDAGNRKRTE